MATWGTVVDDKSGRFIRKATHDDYIAGTSIKAGRNGNRFENIEYTPQGRITHKLRLVWH